MKNIFFSLARAWTLSRSYFLITVVKSIFTALIPLTNIAGLGLVIDALVSGAPVSDVLMRIILYLSVHLAISLISQALTLWDNHAMRKATNVLQYQYMQDCLTVDYHYAQDGKMSNLKKKSMLTQPAFFISDWGDCVRYIVQFMGIIFIFAVLSPLFIAVIAALSACVIGLTIFTQTRDFQFQQEKADDDRKLDYLYHVMTTYKYAKEIRINNAREYIKGKYSAIFKRQTRKLYHLLREKLGVNLLGAALSVLQTALMYLYFTYQVFVGQIDMAQYTVLLASTTLFTTILLSFFKTLGTIRNRLTAVGFYREYEQIIKNNSKTNESNGLGDVRLDFSNAVLKFENVSFQYPNAKAYALKNINIAITPHKKLGIVGLNGSGKTTLVKLLLRLYHPTHGKITLNGIDIANIPHRQYAHHIGVVLQDFSLFAYSLKENIIFDGCFHPHRFYQSIEKSGLTDKVNTLPNGIDTTVYRQLDDSGVELSGGEGQKLALARAIYKNADILILDEPTSALDPMAEYELFSRLNEISDHKTTIFISHRLYSTHFCDDIIVLDKGRVIEQGNHEQLMAQNGFYANLYRMQAKYYQEGVVFP